MVRAPATRKHTEGTKAQRMACTKRVKVCTTRSSCLCVLGAFVLETRSLRRPKLLEQRDGVRMRELDRPFEPERIGAGRRRAPSPAGGRSERRGGERRDPA